MSIIGGLNNAISGLTAGKQALETISNNVSNVNTPGYARKVTELSVRAYTGGGGGGVRVEQITRQVDDYLQQSLRSSTSDTSRSSIYATYAESLESALGQPGQSNDIGVLTGQLRDALVRSATTPGDASLKSSVVDAANKLTKALRDARTAATDLKRQADTEISTSISTVNSMVEGLSGINKQIRETRARGADSGLLEDRRETMLDGLGKLIDYQTVDRGDGSFDIILAGGHLTDENGSNLLSFTQNIGLNGAVTVGNTDVTGQIRSGKIRGLLDVRDNLTSTYTADLDNFASQLAGEVNAIHNDGTGVPGRPVITGGTQVPATAQLDYSGTLRFFVTSSDGQVLSTYDYSTATPGTLSDLAAGLDLRHATATVSNGKLNLAVDDLSSGETISWVEVNPGTVTVDGADTGKSLSHFLGLNDFLVSAGNAANITVRADIAASPSLISQGRLPVGTTPPALGTIVVGVSDGSTLAAIANKLAAPTIDPAHPTAVPISLIARSGALVSRHAVVATNARSASDAQQLILGQLGAKVSAGSGVSLDQEMAQLTVFQNAYNAAGRVLSVADQMYQMLTRIGS